MCRIILCKPQREEDKLIDHEEERRQTHPDITNMISPVLTHISLKFYYRKYMLKKKCVSCELKKGNKKSGIKKSGNKKSGNKKE